MSDTDRLPPQDRAAEQSVIGSMFRLNAVIADVVQVVQVSDFYTDAHQKIFQAIVDLWDKSKPADLVTVCDVLKERKQIDDIGGYGYLAELWDCSPTAAHAEHYAEIVKDKSVKRSLVHAGSEILRDAYDNAAPANELLESSEKLVFDIASARAKSTVTNLDEMVTDAWDRIDKRSSGQQASGVPTGFIDLDEKLGGLRPSELIIVAARPSHGKAQPLEAAVLTPSGFVDMGSLIVGQAVVGSDGLPCRVTGVYPQGELPVYRVTLTDGTSTECCDDHLWFTQTRNEKRCGSHGSIKTLNEIKRTINRPDTRQSSKATPNHAIPVMAAARFASRPATDLDPYCMGLLLGDGSCSKTVILSNPEEDIQSRFAASLPKEDDVSPIKDGITCRIRRKQRTNEVSMTKSILCRYGLDGADCFEKFIPDDYLYGSVSDRLALLRGLCDTDGSVVSGGMAIEYSTSSPRLANDVAFLARSLGGVVNTSSRIPAFSYNGESRSGTESFRLTIRFLDQKIIPVSSRKHLAKWRTATGRRNARKIRDVDFVGYKACQCIKVDAPNELYVTDDFIVTHNTALALSLAVNAARKDFPVLFFSLEQHRGEVADRLLSCEARVDHHKMRKGYIDRQDMEKLITAGGSLKKLKHAHVDDGAGQTLIQIAGTARRMKMKHDIQIVFIDYLQLIEPERGRDRRASNRQEEVSAISRRLKHLARELKVPVVCLAQLNRGPEERFDHKPKLSDLRESGAIEQDADTVILLHRPEMYSRGEHEGVMLVDIAKQRNGPTGELTLTFLKQFTRFENFAIDAPMSYQP